jgi:predicted nucleotidyltransferase
VPIDPALQRRIELALSRHPEICAAWVFGSVARGEARAESDLDLAVLLASGVDVERARARLETLGLELEPCSPSGRVDVLILGTQGPVLVHRVLSEGVLVRDLDPERRIDFEGDATVAYLDWKPTHDIAMRTALAGLGDRFARMGDA